MAATFPESSGLDSVGSVAANFAKTDEEDQRIEFLEFSYGSALVSPSNLLLLSTLINRIIQADLIRVMHGTPAYEKFIDETRLKREAEATQRTERLARRRARSAALKGAYHRLTALFTKQPA